MVTIKKVFKTLTAFILTCVLLIVVFIWAVNTGSLNVSPKQLFEGLFLSFDENVAAVYYLRFPRIIISLFVGAALSTCGVLFQAVLKNPLTDPGIIGISGGAGFAGIVFTSFFPQLLQFVPAVSFIGGMVAFILVYMLSNQGGLSPLRIVLVGVSISTMFQGLSNAIKTLSGGALSGAAAIVDGNITMKTWDDVTVTLYYLPICLMISCLFAGKCNLLALDDKTARGIGVNVNRYRLMISFLAVLLASISTAVAGIISFLGLIVPHMARIFVGNNHRLLLPYSMILGALVFLAADTIGRSIAPPYEVGASVIMAVIGGPFFILLLRGKHSNGS